MEAPGHAGRFKNKSLSTSAKNQVSRKEIMNFQKKGAISRHVNNRLNVERANNWPANVQAVETTV
jgi:hypothetical protein